MLCSALLELLCMALLKLLCVSLNVMQRPGLHASHRFRFRSRQFARPCCEFHCEWSPIVSCAALSVAGAAALATSLASPPECSPPGHGDQVTWITWTAVLQTAEAEEPAASKEQRPRGHRDVLEALDVSAADMGSDEAAPCLLLSLSYA